jgi:hypothetical protein
MAFPSGAAYHADSDADDEYERSVMASPTHLNTDSEASPSDSEPPSNEHTPTTYGNSGEDQTLPRSIITEWTAEECAQFIAGLGLRQYSNAFLGRIREREEIEHTADMFDRQRDRRRSLGGIEARRIERNGHCKRWPSPNDTQECI